MPLGQNNSVLGSCIPHIFPVSLWGVRQLTSSIRVFRNLSFTHSFIHLFIYLFASLQNKLTISQMLQKSTVIIYHKCNVKVSFIPNEGHKKQDWGGKKRETWHLRESVENIHPSLPFQIEEMLLPGWINLLRNELAKLVHLWSTHPLCRLSRCLSQAIASARRIQPSLWLVHPAESPFLLLKLNSAVLFQITTSKWFSQLTLFPSSASTELSLSLLSENLVDYKKKRCFQYTLMVSYPSPFWAVTYETIQHQVCFLSGTCFQGCSVSV